MSCCEISAIVLLFVYDFMRCVLWESKASQQSAPHPSRCTDPDIYTAEGGEYDFLVFLVVFKGILPMRDETKTKLTLMKVTQCAL